MAVAEGEVRRGAPVSGGRRRERRMMRVTEGVTNRGREWSTKTVAEGVANRRREQRTKTVAEGVTSRRGRGKRGRRSVTAMGGAGIGQSLRHVTTLPPRMQNLVMRCPMINSRGAEQMDDEDESIRKMKAAEEALEEKQKQKPSFELSGKLASETNRVRGVTLLFNEPAEARKPDIKWRLYVFKAGEVLNEPLYIHRQSCYLFGRERRVADIPTDHPSCSKQHAVIQFRQVEKEQPDGTLLKQVRPYIMDLGSTNKTFINDGPIEPQRYYELREKDTIKFGNSSREYVLLHENSIGQ
ncbi:FHA domain-containing protein DDL-like isoform X2 [Glycine soja]|uniref:FHA domain-containing protein n=1 Tax=Glycine max TaxID=3847 RepID=A0A0R0EYQ2_SOYBN|nr:FHA domain-containing protein DDL isoform X2 [Glycine max]XP_028215511.1 FHA domain-containing protein DDL-like isoform X2 [Glycine soja]|eukprot:XP_014626583.1 FHA domain-containing protein DDL isoform X2 [Glycine max]